MVINHSLKLDEQQPESTANLVKGLTNKQTQTKVRTVTKISHHPFDIDAKQQFCVPAMRHIKKFSLIFPLIGVVIGG